MTSTNQRHRFSRARLVAGLLALTGFGCDSKLAFFIPPDGAMSAVIDEGTPALERAPDLDGAPESECIAQTLGIAANADDGELQENVLFRDGEAGGQSDPPGLYIGYWEQAGLSWGYFRFVLEQALPSTWTITMAHLSLWGQAVTGDWNRDEHGLQVFVEESADAPTVSSAADNPLRQGGRRLVPLAVSWPASGGLDWQIDRYNTSPDLGALLGLLVRGQQGAVRTLQFWVRGTFVKGQAQVAVTDFQLSADRSARLTVTACP